ncbi:serine/threonine-protein kinase M1 [Extremus antarcticus]|uniref:non-specific serine/threonine protein kinase n=1 Tax=Extremus antarcticus TaxID=702011 RepID=A0AAJ0DHF8_9PEZI|nr:serine/threonine-protein kinase M1 [Extremus antarcticus]
MAPPSTLAAQIVQNQTRSSAPQQNGEKATFAQLLHELLNNRGATPETDVQINVKLISVVAEAGLAPLVDGNPFADHDALLAQAIDSITVIETTIRRQPEVLFTSVVEDGPQLLLPLLARLLAVGGRSKCEGLPIVRLFDATFAALKASLDLWHYAQALQQIVQDCADEAILTLEAAVTAAPDFSIKLPPAKVVARLWPQSDKEIALPHGCQATVSHASSALVLAQQLSTIAELSSGWKDETSIRLQDLVSPLRKKLEDAGQYESTVSGLLSASSYPTLLSTLVEDTLKTTPSHYIQRAMAVNLLRVLQQDSGACRDVLLPILASVVESDVYDSLHEDLRIATTTVLCGLMERHDRPDRLLALEDALRQDNIMTDSEFFDTFKQLSVAKQASCDGPRRRKRRKIDASATNDAQGLAVVCTVGSLTAIESVDCTSLEQLTPAAYYQLSDHDKYAVWQGLAQMAPVNAEAALEAASAIVEPPGPEQNKQIRVLAMLAIRACVERTLHANYLDLRHSAFGQMCVQSLHSSIRELRFAAGQTLVAFLREELPEELRSGNRKFALEYLRRLSDRDIACEHDTLIAAWGYVAFACGDVELNLALLRLVDYLGHSNPLICGLAFAELEKLATTRQQSVEEMFKPYWSSVAVSVSQDLQTRPQKAQQICDLLGMDLNQWLVQTQQDTIPSLVLTKKTNILARIAAARGSGTTIVDLCMKPRTNLAATLAVLLVQSGPDVEEAASACLSEISTDFPDLSSLVKLDATLVACFMLKYIGEQFEKQKSKGYQAFQVFANISERRPGQAKAHSKAAKTVMEFFENHILGIMTYFSEVLENAQGMYTSQEKIQCINAIGEMITMVKQHVNVALPQIRAALQSSMEQKTLCEAALTVWLDLVSVLNGEDIALVLDQTFALILRHWQSLSSSLQHSTHDKICGLVKTHNQVVQDNVMALPSLKEIPLLSKLGAEIERLKSHEGVEVHGRAFAKRLRDESSIVVLQALKEIVTFLELNQDFVLEAAVSEQPATVLSDLLRALLDAGTKYSAESKEAADLVGKALGIIGCLDPNRIEATRKRRKALVLSNFDKADETTDWVIVLLEDVLVKAFKSVNNARAQGFLAYVLQELLRFCNLNDSNVLRPRASQAPSAHQKWANMPESVRITLTPFVKSRYVVRSNVDTIPPNRTYPGFTVGQGHTQWLRSLVYDLMWKAKGDNAQMVFPLLARVIRGHDLAIASFLLPYAMLNIVLGGTVAEVNDMSSEMRAVLGAQPTDTVQQETVKLCSESIFSVLDYMSTWLQEKKMQLGETRSAAYRTGQSPSEFDEAKDMAQIDIVEQFLASIPAEVIATQAVICGSYARALFNWEQYIRQKRPLIPSSKPPQKSSEDEALYNRLHDIYAQIDEPDGLEGISAHLPFLSEEQQAMQHAKAGRWTAAQTWYESELAEKPGNVELEDSLLRCLRVTGQYGPLLRYVDSFTAAHAALGDVELAQERLLPVTVEAHWMTGDLIGIKARLASELSGPAVDFNVGIAKLIGSLSSTRNETRLESIKHLRRQITQGFTLANTSSIQASHDDLKKLHVLYEIEALSSGKPVNKEDNARVLERRLSILGSYVADKQDILGIRRLVMQCLPHQFDASDLGTAWLTSAKLARQSRNTQQAYNAVLRANECGDKTAKLEEARLLWRDGHQRHAIQALESSITSGVFESDTTAADPGVSSNLHGTKQDMLSAKASLLLAKWLDALGQNQAKDMTDKYQFAARHFQRWEKGHYYLGKHYQKLLESEKALPKDKQTNRYKSGELTRLVIENLLRSVPFGNKYWHETIPKLLTLWLDLGLEATKTVRGEDRSVAEQRMKASLQATRQLQKYFDRVPPFVFYSAMPQMISRITHSNPEVWRQLCNILTRLVASHPSQALWSLLAVIKASDQPRVDRGMEILNRLKERKSSAKTDGVANDLRMLIAQSQKLSEGLLQACEAHVEQRVTNVSLSKDLGFNHKLAPNPLVVPIETTLTASLPSGAGSETIRKHRAFVQDKITINSFSDHVLVLSSLQRPRKLTVRGSDGKQYGLLCKPKDDLRKDQRLMEFNGIINRALKRDAESSKRRLYIKTYAVTPLSEESGTIEWVEGIKPMRDILLGIYGRRGIRPNYGDLRKLLDEASADAQTSHVFLDKVLPTFPACLHEWFTEVYPEPDAWFAARLRYTRTAAVMSVVGHVLGLGDRHGENILLEESTGGVFHVDFNCLFDKGLTFEKPEVVPFRLTHNMVDAMGPYGQSKDTLMTILETFLYDPTTDFVELKKKKKSADGVPETPPEILDSVAGKLKGLLRGETVPLGVEGYVDALIREATSPWNLARMYIGWCAFL